MAIVHNYEEQVYAGVLGKIIGVYMGRPFEGWEKDALVERFGTVDRYVHEDFGVPLIVSDDDISGTLTFVRALEDSGQYAETPEDFYGDTWLNYLIEGKTILWWGHMGHSTEHTAYLRLKEGIRAPASGSIARNGKLVAEQIGAQIFIDGFGLVAPGDPRLAARLAASAARVSHDGEAVYAAQVVAAMVSAAFVEKRMEALLDIGCSVIPETSLIARLHRDVRGWCRQDGDWQKTYRRIRKKYGYAKYGGGCHVVPNHAIMVMAWCYAPDDFHASQAIINTAGWDTDCNAANVGAVMGVKVGLEEINRRYDFRGPVADRLLLPTADGTDTCSDALTEALRIARIGRRVMGWPPTRPPKGGAIHHFSLPGSVQGYRSEDDRFCSSGTATVENVPDGKGDRALAIHYQGLTVGRMARVSAPLFPRAKGAGAYAIMAVPRLVQGQTVALEGQAEAKLNGVATARLFVRHYEASTQTASAMAYGKAVRLRPGKPFHLRLAIPDTGGWPVQDVGIEITGERYASGTVRVRQVDFGGRPKVQWTAPLPCDEEKDRLGWISSLDKNGWPLEDLTRNRGRGLLVTGTREWTDYAFEAEVAIHMADRAGIVIRYQGLERYIALVRHKNTLQLIQRYYGDTILAECPDRWPAGKSRKLRLVAKGKRISAYADGKKLLDATDDRLGCGGAGFLVEAGRMIHGPCRVFA